MPTPRVRDSATRQLLAHQRVRHRESALAARRPGDRREHGGDDPTGFVDHRPARVAGPHPTPQRGDAAHDRPVAVRVLGADDLGLTDPAGLDVERAVERIAEDRRAGAGPRIGGQLQRRLVQAVDAQHRDVVVGVEVDHVGVEPRRVAADLDRGVGLPGDHVGVGDHQPRSGDPAAALDPEAAGGAEHLHHAAAGGGDAARRDDAAGRRRHVGGRPAHRRQRVDPRERMQERPRRRQQLVELLEDRRALDVVAEHRRARRLERDRADDPRDPERHRSGQDRAEHAVDEAEPRHPQEHAGARPEPLQAAGQHRAGEQRAHQPEQRRVLGVRAAGQHERREVGAEERSEAEPEQRQGADDEPLRVAVERQQHRERHDQPVDFRHR